MTRAWATPVFLFLFLFALWTPATGEDPAPRRWDPASFMGIDEIEPGMRGVGRSVFQGTRIEEFEVEILGVLRGSSPHADMILARLSGQDLEKTGIIAGMSGSPVYLEGRLIGALAFGWPFSAEPIGGITPIASMLGLLDRSGGQPPTGAPPGEGRLSPGVWEALWKATGAEAWDLLVSDPPRGADLSPLNVPVSISGLHPGTIAQATAVMQGWGLLPVQGGGRGCLRERRGADPGGGGGSRPGAG